MPVESERDSMIFKGGELREWMVLKSRADLIKKPTPPRLLSLLVSVSVNKGKIFRCLEMRVCLEL